MYCGAAIFNAPPMGDPTPSRPKGPIVSGGGVLPTEWRPEFPTNTAPLPKTTRPRPTTLHIALGWYGMGVPSPVRSPSYVDLMLSRQGARLNICRRCLFPDNLAGSAYHPNQDSPSKFHFACERSHALSKIVIALIIAHGVSSISYFYSTRLTCFQLSGFQIN